MTPDELEQEGMAPAAVPHVLCGARELTGDEGMYRGESCVFLPHTTGLHSWGVTRTHVAGEGPRIGGNYGASS